ncbi:MAG: hypothetical protein QOJ51_6673 [Acidobacteriaceae bacterium]|jgi:hypothetical protein|nr:hypothetical protein [Acidobacteriaceae bacterium]MEA2263848.1 hypothetical protein [Acidobacteriaceae bacterium]
MNTSVETMWDRRSKQIGQRMTTETVAASPTLGMLREHPLQRTTLT